MKVERVDAIVFDLKQSIDDLSHELKLMIEDINTLSEKIELITEEKNNS